MGSVSRQHAWLKLEFVGHTQIHYALLFPFPPMPRQSERQKSANELLEVLYAQLVLESFTGPCDTNSDLDSDSVTAATLDL